MPKLDTSVVVLDGAKQILGILKKEIQSLENTKARLIKESDDLQKTVNDLYDKAHSIDNVLKEKEQKLMEKIKAREDEWDRKLKELNTKLAETSCLNAGLTKSIEENKKAKLNYERQASFAEATTSSNEKSLKELGEIVKLISDKLSKI